MKEHRGIYHVFNKSIAGYVVFNGNDEYQRMLRTMTYYRIKRQWCKFSYFLEWTDDFSQEVVLDSYQQVEGWVTIIGHCLMPTHIHLILAEMCEGGIAKFMGLILNSYTRYFNTKHHRKGPLWQGRSKKVLVGSNEQLLHLTRYVHLNPVTAGLVDHPNAWQYSSFREYLGQKKEGMICDFHDAVMVIPQEYETFCTEYIDGQRELAFIKKLMLD